MAIWWVVSMHWFLCVMKLLQCGQTISCTMSSTWLLNMHNMVVNLTSPDCELCSTHCTLCSTCFCIVFPMVVHCVPNGCALCATWLCILQHLVVPVAWWISRVHHTAQMQGNRREEKTTRLSVSIVHLVTHCASLYVYYPQIGRLDWTTLLTHICSRSHFLAPIATSRSHGDRQLAIQALLPLIPIFPFTGLLAARVYKSQYFCICVSVYVSLTCANQTPVAHVNTFNIKLYD